MLDWLWCNYLGVRNLVTQGYTSHFNTHHNYGLSRNACTQIDLKVTIVVYFDICFFVLYTI